MDWDVCMRRPWMAVVPWAWLYGYVKRKHGDGGWEILVH